MAYSDSTYIETQDLNFEGVLNDIKKSRLALAPIFEAFTNAIEAIKIKSGIEKEFHGQVAIRIDAVETTTDATEFHSITISDNGIGFNNTEFKRFNTFKDFTKGYKNLGSGRLQYAHYFDSTVIRSTFKEGDHFYDREFVVSKDKKFLKQNAIVFHKFNKRSQATESATTITFHTLLENSPLYNGLNHETLKENLIERYLHYFCYNRKSLPSIKIEFFVQSKKVGIARIEEKEIPEPDKTETLQLPYNQLSPDGKSIVETGKNENFKITAFKADKKILKDNRLNLVSKEEIVEESPVKLENLREKEDINGFKFLFLVSSNYIDARDTNLRGQLLIPTKELLSKAGSSLFSGEEIFIEDIQAGLNATIDRMYPEIEKAKQHHDKELEKLKAMFLLDDETAQDISISINDSETRILEKFYEADAKKEAHIDASIKLTIDKLNALDTTAADYLNKLEEEIKKLVNVIPEQNKIALTHYVARRKLVLELFAKIINNELIIQKTTGRNIDEKLLHNVIFQQTHKQPDQSDLWLVNEDFIFFKGTSEDKLKDVIVNGEPLLRDSLTDKERAYRLSLSEDRYAKRPDILLFPDEGKCIIIEFKNPSVNVSEHLTQINNYASLIKNFSKTHFSFQTFYGYLIGENIDSYDVRSADSDFKESYHFDYLFRPSKTVVDFFSDEKIDGTLYTEVIKYSTLLKRAKKRNEIFIAKLSRVSS